MVDQIQVFLLSFEGRVLTFAPYLFFVLLLRYILISGGLYYLFWVATPSFLRSRRIQPKPVPKKQIIEEVAWSLSSIFMNTLLGLAILKLYFLGWTQIYLDFSGWAGWGYVALSLIIYLLVHDAYFYWMHRGLHHPWWHKHVHHIHHKPTNPTPFAAFCFHPLEAFLEMAFLLPLILLVPIHFMTLVVFLILTFVLNVNGHLGYELLPHGAWRRWWGSWLTTSTHHNMHHQFYRSNYALYLRGWDQWFGTLHPKTQDVFEAITSGRDRPIR